MPSRLLPTAATDLLAVRVMPGQNQPSDGAWRKEVRDEEKHWDRERARRATARLRVLQHYEQVSRNNSRTFRFFGISRTLFYEWRRRYQREGLEGLKPPPAGTSGESVSHRAAHRSAGPPGPAGPPVRGPAAPALPPAIPCGLALHAHHPADPARAPCALGLPKRYRPGPKRRPELHIPG